MALASEYLTAFLAAYIECAIWASTDEEGKSLDSLNYGPDDLTRDARALMRVDCRQFLREALPMLERAKVTPEQAGHDFWLTRNRHGAGFWDRGLGDVGQKLTEIAHSYGGSDIYINRKKLNLC